MKKFVVLVTLITMVCTYAVPCAMAEENIELFAADGLEDYVPGKMPANLIPDSNEGGGFMYFGTRLGKAEYSDFDTTDQGVSSAFKYSYTGTGSLVPTMNWGGFEGFFLNRNRGDGKGSFGFVPAAGKSYVFKANVKNASPEGVTPSFGIGMNGTWGSANIITAKEYGLAGMPLTNEWQEFKGTLVLPDSFKDDTTYGATPLVGFAAGAPEGSAFWLDVSEKDSVYFCEEKAYDIKVSRENGFDEKVHCGDNLEFKGEVINQIGINGSLKQNFVWNVFNVDKKTIADGFNVPEIPVQNADIEVLDSAECGDYYVMAISTDYSMVRSYKITVVEENNFDEYVPGRKNSNLIPDSTEEGGFMYFGTRLGKTEYSDLYTTDQGVGSAFKYSYTGTGSLVPTMNWGGFEGFFLNRNRGDGKGSFGFVPAAGKSYVFKANVKNASPEGVTPSFGIGMNGTWGPANIITTREYGLAGMPLTNEWQEFKGTLVLPDSFKDDTTYGATPLVGFAAGAPEGSAFWLDVSEKDSVYLAEEQLYDITNSIVGEENNIHAGDKISFKAEIVNQIGAASSFEQNFNWYVSNEEKTQKVKGFEILTDKNNAQITITEDVEPGTYFVYADSLDYKKMRRAVRIDIKKALIDDKEYIDENNNDSAKKIVITSNDDDDVISMRDEYILNAVVLNQADESDSLEQSFNWYVINNDKETVAEAVTIEKLDSQNAKVTVGFYAEPGEYYAVCEPEKYTGIRKIYKFTVDKLTAAEAALEMINTMETDELSKNLKECFEVLGIEGEYIDNADIKEVSALIRERVKNGKLTNESVLSEVQKLAVISLYNKNNNNIDLYDKDGEFIYGDILETDKFFEGTTLKNISDEIISNEGKIALQKGLIGKGFKNENEFYKALAESIILKAIEYPSVMGTKYIESVLTLQNAKKAEINIDKYSNLKNKTDANQTIARKSFTKQTLESAISALKEPSESNGGGTGGGSGSSNKGHSPSTQSPQIIPNTTNDEFYCFDDVSDEHWGYDQIYHLKKIGVISGVEANKFMPDMEITREQFVKMFIDAFKYKKVNKELPYIDAKYGEWYNTYLATAFENGLINGISENEFGVGMPISRQDICVIVLRAMGVDTEESQIIEFSDYEEISDYAKASVKYLTAYGVINGFTDGTFRPKDNCTRVQAVKIICTLMNIGGIAE